MNFLISDTFSDSLARLTGEEQKAVKTTAFDLQMNPAQPSLSFHKLDKARDKNFWSVRVNRDIRVIVHRSDQSLLLCYTDHHDKAYAWAERRKLETHPKTGAAQIVEIRETVQEILIPTYTHSFSHTPQKGKPKRFPLAKTSSEELLRYGVPLEWIGTIQESDEDAILAVAEHLPAEAAEAVLELATGGKPRAASFVHGLDLPRETASVTLTLSQALEHPDAKRRFRILNNVEELEAALDSSWDKWTIFLHPEQKQGVEASYSGPTRVSGSAGTGKTIVALHRTVYLAKQNEDARVLLCTFSEPLANALRIKLRRLLVAQPRLGERIDIYGLDALAFRLYEPEQGTVHLVDIEELKTLINEASAQVKPHKFTPYFLLMEWIHVVDAWNLTTWEEYRDVSRLGRKTRLPAAQREILWSIFALVQKELLTKNQSTNAQIFTSLAKSFTKKNHKPYDHIVVDECQDLSVYHIRFFAALGGADANTLFFAGDLGQRIFQQPFSWKSLGVDIRGRSKTLRVNYRTSHQIRTYADRLLGSEVNDVDGNIENRKDTVSVFNGPNPEIKICLTEQKECEHVSQWLKQKIESGVNPQEIGLFVRSAKELERAKQAVEHAGLKYCCLDEDQKKAQGQITISTMHLAKGLEFKAVVVMACDDEVIPSQLRIETVGDEADLSDVYETERHLLYVACTRARDALLVTAVKPESEFLADMKQG